MQLDRSLFSQHWHKVAALKPRLRRHVNVRCRWSRGQRWYLLIDEATRRVHRLDEAAWSFLGLCNGERTVEAAWEASLARQADASLTQNEAVTLLTRMRDAGVVHLDLPADGARLAEQGGQQEQRRIRAGVNPLAFRLPLGDPTRWLDALLPLAGRWPAAPVLVVWALLVGAALLCAIAQAPMLADHGARWLPTQRYLLLMWLLYPPIKALHELGHALVVRRLGGEVREIGLTLLLLMPVPYVDASAANGFERRRDRALVSAAGIMVELALAAVALLVWLSVETGLARDIAFVIFFIGGASTLLVNGNPLIRMDGYFVLCDVLDLPNLADRSRGWWRERGRRWFTGLHGFGPVPARNEAPWLAFYAPLSWLYRAAMAVWIVSWVGSIHAWLGAAAALLLIWQLLLGPLIKSMGQMRLSTLPRPARNRARVRLGLVVVALLGAVAFPVPDVSRAHGVVWLPEDAWVRTGTEGLVLRLVALPQAVVSKGDVIAELADDQLLAERDGARVRLAALSSQLYAELGSAPSRSMALAAQIEAAQSALEALEARVQALSVRAPADGQLVVERPSDLPGRWIARGTPIAYVVPPALRTVRIAVQHEDARNLAGALKQVELRSWDAPGRVVRASHDVVVPAATRRLPSPALGDAYGGHIVLDPSDANQSTARDPIAVFDVIADEPIGQRIGTRVSVRMVLGETPLAMQVLRRLRQWTLRHFRADS